MFSKLFIVLIAFYSVSSSAIITISVSDGDSIVTEMSSCNNQGCNRLCRRLGFPVGICVGNMCKCYQFKELNAHKAEASYSVSDSCVSQWCDKLCRFLGYPGGTCVGNQCGCFKSESFKDYSSAITSPEDCNIATCNDYCRGLNLIGGMCWGGVCKCY